MEPIKVQWDKFTIYSNSGEYSERAGIGFVIAFVHSGTDTIAVIERGNKFLQIPLGFITKWQSPPEPKLEKMS